MKSNKSLFNATLFKSNILRFLPFSILYTIIELVIFPLVLFFSYGAKNSIDFEDLLATGAVSDAFSAVFAGVFAILVFGYLFSANKSNALHAFPIGRKALFTTNTVSAYVLLVVPQLIGFVLGTPAMLMFAKTGVLKVFIPMNLAMIFLFSFIVLSIGILAMMLSGNAFAGFIIYGILNFLYAAAVVLLSFAVAFFGYGLKEEIFITDSKYLLSPIVNIFVNMSNYTTTEIQKVFSVDISPAFYISLAVYFAAAIVICAVAFLLYKLRELEVAGEMAAFEKELPFIRVIVSVIGAIVITMSIGSIINAGRIGMIALYVVFSFMVYFAAQMILKRKFNIFSGKLILRWVICCAVSIGAVLGLAAYETSYTPDAAKVENASINLTYDIKKQDEKGVKQIEELQKELIRYTKASDDENIRGSNRLIEDYAVEEDPYKFYLSVEIEYTLKNGKTVEREYAYKGDDKKINTLIKALESENSYVNIFDSLDEIGVKYTVKNINITEYTEAEAEEYSIDVKNCDEFIDICKKDVNALTKNHSSLVKTDESYSSTDISINCKLDKDNDKEVLEKLKELSISRFIEGYCSYDEFGLEEPYSDLNIYISSLPRDSETLQYAKENNIN
jgi:ABC-2 type transport system permease protein